MACLTSTTGSQANSADEALIATTPRQLALKIQKTRELPLSGDPVKAIEVLAHRQPPHDIQPTEVPRHLIVERNLTADGLVTAVTHRSQDVSDSDRPADFEALGRTLIEVPTRDWSGGVTTA